MGSLTIEGIAAFNRSSLLGIALSCIEGDGIFRRLLLLGSGSLLHGWFGRFFRFLLIVRKISGVPAKAVLELV